LLSVVTRLKREANLVKTHPIPPNVVGDLRSAMRVDAEMLETVAVTKTRNEIGVRCGHAARRETTGVMMEPPVT